LASRVAVCKLRRVTMSPVATQVPPVAVADATGDDSSEALPPALAEGDWAALPHPATTSKPVATTMAATGRSKGLFKSFKG